MAFVIGEQCLGTLGPESFHWVLGLAAVLPLQETHQNLVGLAGLDLIGIGLFDDAHNVRHVRLPAALREDERGLV